MTDLNKFREDTKKWLDKNCPPSMRNGADPKIPVDEVWGGRNAVYKNPESKIWLERMGEKGWTMPTVPKEYGGGGLTKDEVKILNEEMFFIGAKQPLLSFGIWMLAPVLLEYGTEEQKNKFLPNPVLFIVFKNCLGIIISVSMLTIGKYAGILFSVLNFCI